MKRPRLKRTVEIVELDGDLVLMRNGRDDVRLEAPGVEELALLEALDGTCSPSDLMGRFEKAAEHLVALGDVGLLEDAADEESVPTHELDRFDRQLRYFGDIAESDGPSPSECQARLREATVAILGVGGLGGRVALDLASCGVGELWLIDCDEVETSNLNRQIQFSEADVGRVKVKVAAERLHAFNSAISVRATEGRLEGEDDIATFIAGADFVVDAADWPAFDIERWVNKVCFEAGTPYIGMSHIPPFARVGPLFVPGETGCYACQEAGFRRSHPMFDQVREQLRAKPSTAPTFGPACGLTAGVVATEVVHFLTGVLPPTTLGASLVYDLRTQEVEREEVVREPGCPVCSGPSLQAAA